jgi:glycosyltransferase involved in cell wall biosynthesis
MLPTRPLRIALISEHASPLAPAGGVDAGGQNVYVAHVAEALARRGHRVDVLTRRDAAGLPDVVALRRHARCVHVPAGPACFVPKERLLEHMPAFMRAAGRWMHAHGPYDVIHANFFMSGWVGLGLQRLFAVPLVVTFHALGLVRRAHQGTSDTFPLERIEIERRLASEASRIVAECPQDRDDLVGLYAAAPGRIDIVPCGVDRREFAPGDRRIARRWLGLDEREFVVLQLGRLVPRKGVEQVIRAVARLPPRLRARLLVVGGESPEPDEARTPEIARLRTIARECGIAERVVFTGRRDRAELARYYTASDVFVTTPLYEPFGITPLEAMACGVPVIGSAVGGIQHSVADGVTGFLVGAGDVDALAARLAQLHADPRLGRALGRAGIERGQRLFTWEHVADGLVRTYRRALRQPSAVGAVRGMPGALQWSLQAP